MEPLGRRHVMADRRKWAQGLAKSGNSLPPPRKAKIYRAHAADALKLADKASDPAVSAHYMRLAAQWHALATEAEHSPELYAAQAQAGIASSPDQPENQLPLRPVVLFVDNEPRMRARALEVLTRAGFDT